MFFAFITAHFLCLLLPGPAHAMITYRSRFVTLKQAIFFAIGIGLGDLCLAISGLLATDLILENRAITLIIKAIGVLYFGYLSYKLLTDNARPLNEAYAQNTNNQLLLHLASGFILTLINIKAIMLYIGLFIYFIKLDTSIFMKSAYCLWAFFATALFFILLSIFFKKPVIASFLIKRAKIVNLALIAFLIYIAGSIIMY